jgi:hypothetical protein
MLLKQTREQTNLFEEISQLKREKELQTKLLEKAKEEISQLKREKEEISSLKREKELKLKSDLNAMKATHDKTNQELKLKLEAAESNLFKACERIDELETEKKKQEEIELLKKELLKNLDEKNDKDVKGEESNKGEGEKKATKNDKEVKGVEKAKKKVGGGKCEKKDKKEGGGGGKGEKKDKKEGGGGGKGEEEPSGKKGGKAKGKEEGGKGQSSGMSKEEAEMKNVNILMGLKNLKKVVELCPNLDDGFNMIVKVMQVSVTREKAPQIAEGKIGDNTGVVNFKVIGKNVKQMKERLGSFVKLINVRIEFVEKKMRIQPAVIEQFETFGWEPKIKEEYDLSELEFKEV